MRVSSCVPELTDSHHSLPHLDVAKRQRDEQDFHLFWLGGQRQQKGEDVINALNLVNFRLHRFTRTHPTGSVSTMIFFAMVGDDERGSLSGHDRPLGCYRPHTPQASLSHFSRTRTS